MSFLSDLFEGNFSNLGNDLAPSNILSDAGSDASKAFSNPVFDVGLGLTALTAGLAAPALLGGDALAAGAGAADLGAAAGGAGSLSGLTGADVTFLDPTLLGEDATTAGVSASGLPLTSGGLIDTTASGFVPAAGGGAGADASLTGSSTALDLGAPGLAGTSFAAPTPLVPATSPVSAAAAAAPGPISTFASNLTGGLVSPGTMSAVGGALPTAVGVGGLGYSLYEGYETKKAQDALTAQENQIAAGQAANATQIMQQAQPLINSGQILTSYLTNNTLPPQFQSMVTQWVKAQKAQITQGYASRGMSSDPAQNSGLQQDLANVDQQALTMQAQLESTLSTAGQQMVTVANQLIASGISATNLASEIPIQVSQLNNTLNTQMASVIANFAAALNGGNRGNAITLQVPSNVITPSGSLNFSGSQ